MNSVESRRGIKCISPQSEDFEESYSRTPLARKRPRDWENEEHSVMSLAPLLQLRPTGAKLGFVCFFLEVLGIKPGSPHVQGKLLHLCRTPRATGLGVYLQIKGGTGWRNDGNNLKL